MTRENNVAYEPAAPAAPDPTSGRDQPGRTALAALAGFWLAFFVLYTLRAALIAPDEILGKFGPRTAVTIVGALLSWAMYRVVERAPARSLGGKIAWTVGASVPTAMVFALGDAVWGGVIKPDLSLWCPNSATCSWMQVWELEVDNTIVWTFLFSAWGLLHQMLRATAETRAADQRAHAERQAARIAEIRALRYQLNPHFLYNCLNSLSALVRRKRIEQAEDMIGDLGQFIRFSLMVDPVADVSLDSEVEMQLRYLELERWRFADRVRLEVSIADEVSSAAVPSLILQPLVENAVKHGLDAQAGRVTIRIGAGRLADGGVRVVVDNLGTEPLRGTAGEGFGIGLSNVRARLDARFGEAAWFAAEPAGDCGFRAELRFPYEPVTA